MYIYIYSYDTSAFGNVARRRDNLSAYNVTFEQYEELAAHYKWEGIVPDVSSSLRCPQRPTVARSRTHALMHASRKRMYVHAFRV